MRLPRFTNTLHFRLSALFLVLLAMSGIGFKLWIDSSVLTMDMAEEEEQWFAEYAEQELDTLAAELGELSFVSGELTARIQDYTAGVAGFGVELLLFDAHGTNITSSNPDSLSVVVPNVDPELVGKMTLPEWDYGSYPNPDFIDAWVNRIFEVDVVRPAAEDFPFATPIYLVASYSPHVYSLAELDTDKRQLGVRALLMILVFSALVALIIMAWTSRRISHLSEGVAAFAAGDLSKRVNDGSADEIGTLGRSFNHMAGSIENMVEKLQEKEQFQQQLIANVSHDLRTPMASLRGYVETMKVRFHDLNESERNRYLSIVINNLDHLDGLVEQMLILSRFDCGQATFKMEEFPPGELADSVIMRCEGLATERGVTLELITPDDLPLVVADALQIAQVLQNLLENGIKFNQAGGSVIVRLAKNGSRVGFSVTDTGMGISETDLPHIFDRFYTSDKSRTRTSEYPTIAAVQDHLGQSSGLGLAIAAKIVAGHDSVLKVESEIGVGTTFRFTLPAGQSMLELSEGA